MKALNLKIRNRRIQLLYSFVRNLSDLLGISERSQLQQQSVVSGIEVSIDRRFLSIRAE